MANYKQEVCQKHGLTKFKSVIDKYVKSGVRFRCMECIKEWQKNRRQDLKLKAVASKGGKCECCGYNKCVAALDFHHLNPEEKDFDISKLASSSWKNIKEEVEKCILVCSNCHREIHAGVRKLEKRVDLKSTDVVSSTLITSTKE